MRTAVAAGPTANGSGAWARPAGAKAGARPAAVPAPVPPACSPSELPEGERSVLETVVGSRWAWVARIYFTLAGRDADVGSLATRGLVECFDTPLSGVAMPTHAPQGPGVTLTPYGAFALRVELVPCLSRQGAETDRSRWMPVKFDPDGRPLAEKRSRGAKVPRSFGSLHITEAEARDVVDGAPSPEYLIDEFNGEAILCFAGPREGAADGDGDGTAASPSFAADAGTLMGGVGGGPARRGIPIVRDKRLRGKK
jgi:hypothetical protein